ncbi:rho GTPase-activating protein 36 isoform X2 [Ascaphus truei]|uniref:rho GTPase-activating protein 36 isoform X2 n=1 Tax=Ascaphus truei TaxID=8439 RepID=UPI003F5971B5
MLGPVFQLPTVPLQTLSELERFCLQEIALHRLQERGLCCDITPDLLKRKKSVRRRLDKRDCPLRVFGVPLSHVIAQDCTERQRVSAVRHRRFCDEVESSVLSFLVTTQRVPSRRHGHILGTSLELTAEPLSPTFRDSITRERRRGALSVDSITELDDSNARLLEALHLSHPAELQNHREEQSSRLSLNPIYRQVPRIVERCCSHIESYGLQTVGIFRVGSSKKRVQQLREEFDLGGDKFLGEDTCVHDVSALLKQFLRELPDPVLPRELYPAFIYTAGLDPAERLCALQFLLFLLPPCNADTLLRLLQLLHKVALQAQDTSGATGEQVPGNKMSASNLATIFGPNLLQSDRAAEHDVQSMQDSGAQIRVTETLIQHHQELYMVPCLTHRDILISLLQTDPEVIDYLLRRKFSSAQMSDSGCLSTVDMLQWSRDLGSPQSTPSLRGHSPLETLLQLLSTGGRTGPLEFSSRLSYRRPSRSQENLSICPPAPPLRPQQPSRPRFLPLFSRTASSTPPHSLDSPSPVTSHAFRVTPDGGRKPWLPTQARTPP